MKGLFERKLGGKERERERKYRLRVLGRSLELTVVQREEKIRVESTRPKLKRSRARDSRLIHPAKPSRR